VDWDVVTWHFPSEDAHVSPGQRRKTTAELRAQVAASGKSMVEIMVQNARWADDQVEALMALLPRCVPDELPSAIANILMYREKAQRWARDAAEYFHPKLQAIAHNHHAIDGSTVRPVIEITGYPTEPIAPPPAPLPALTDAGETPH
jgi:hypothetical protein